jgi:hypothetical protein
MFAMISFTTQSNGKCALNAEAFAQCLESNFSADERYEGCRADAPFTVLLDLCGECNEPRLQSWSVMKTIKDLAIG